jgi:hypothetical protein
VTCNLPPPLLEFYWVVPYGRFSDWQGKTPKTLLVQKKNPKKLKSVRLSSMQGKRYVNQYVLSLDRVSPNAKAIFDRVAAQPPLEGMSVVVEGNLWKVIL